MKKLALVFALILFLVGCSHQDVDPYAAFRHQAAASIFNNAEKSLEKGSYAESVQNFEALDAIYPFGPYAQQGQLDIIYAYYMDGDDASSVAAADRYIRLYPRGKNVPYAYYMRGVIGFVEGLSWLQKMVGTDPAPRDVTTLQKSFTSFSTVVELFPESRYAHDSLVRMTSIRNMMARREIEIAGFYLERKAYIAAANRASYVVQHFQDSPQVIQALAIMVKSYRSLGLTKMADSTYKLLQVNYPNSSEFKKLG